jgi:hypothetical protein
MSSNTFCNCQLLGGWYLWRFPLRFACHIPTACRQDRRDPGFYPTLPERDLGIHPVGGLTQTLDCYSILLSATIGFFLILSNSLFINPIIRRYIC